MEYRKLGSSGLDVSVVGLGTNNFGRRLDYEASERVVLAALYEGVNTIDTSNSYGDSLSEEYIGRALEGRRGEVVIATKVASPRGDGPNSVGASRKHILDQIEGSLRRLRTDHVDLYQIHFPDPATPIDETLRTLDDLVKAGKVRYTGCSNFAGWQLAQAMERAIAVGAEPFASVQPPYSMLQREIEKELVPCCEEYGVGILPYFPLANGLLTGKYRRGQPAPEGTRLGDDSPRARATLGGADYDVLEALEAFAAARGRTMVELAIAWLLANPLVGSVIAGATRPEQVQGNASAAGWELSENEMGELDGVLCGG